MRVATGFTHHLLLTLKLETSGQSAVVLTESLQHLSKKFLVMRTTSALPVPTVQPKRAAADPSARRKLYPHRDDAIARRERVSTGHRVSLEIETERCFCEGSEARRRQERIR